MIYTAGSGETLQPVIAGSVELGLAVGTLGAIAAYSKGAPVRIIGAEATGAADYWYVKASSPIKTLKDLNGKTIAYSTAGSSTESVVRAFIKENGLTSAKAVSTGGAPSTMTAVMTDQVDAGWASPPGGLKEIDEGKIRLLARATDAAIVRGQTIRTIVANAQFLEKRKDVVERYMQAYRETIDYMYGDNPQVLKDYAAFAGVQRSHGQAGARRVLPARLGDARRDQGSRRADGGCGRAEIHPGAAEQGADRRAGAAAKEAVAGGAAEHRYF